MKLFKEYIKERENLSLYETEHGFVTYMIKDDWLLIQDIYVTPIKRRSGLAKELADHVVNNAIKEGVKKLYSQTDTRALNWKDSVSFIKAYGCQVLKTDENSGIIYFVKDIG